MICPDCNETVPTGQLSCSCGWLAESIKPASTTCGCGQPGLIKRDDVWTCAACAGYQSRKRIGTSYRERWYAARGLPYEPPRLSVRGWRGVSLGQTFAHTEREPGEDPLE